MNKFQEEEDIIFALVTKSKYIFLPYLQCRHSYGRLRRLEIKLELFLTLNHLKRHSVHIIDDKQQAFYTIVHLNLSS